MIAEHIVGTNGELGLGVSTALPNSENGWPPRPFQIVSLLHMFRYYPKKLVTGVTYLNSVVTGLSYTKIPDWHSKEPSESTLDHANTVLNSLKKVCDETGLETSSSLIEDAIHMITPTEKWAPTNDVLDENLVGVRKTIAAELRGVIFLRINKSDQRYYENESLFGADVEANFSDAKYDISEAGKCLALDRSTACVLHLMRVLELGLNSLANHFQVPFEHVNWDTVIGQVVTKIKTIADDPNRPATWREDRQFYSEVANQFRFFKDSWRNYAMHIHDKYTPEESLIIYERQGVHGRGRKKA